MSDDESCTCMGSAIGPHSHPAPVSAVAGPEPGEGRKWATLPLWDAETARREHEDPIVGLWAALNVLWPHLRALAAPAAAPVGDEEAREAAAAVIRRARYQPAARADRTFDQHLADELHTAGLLAAPGDEGAARAAVARVEAKVERWEKARLAMMPVAAVRAALSAVSGEHREDTP